MTLFIFLNRVFCFRGAEAVGCDIYADGLSCGRLEIYTEGLYTVFEASVYEAENLMRLYLKCRGSIIPLGVLRPCGGSA